MRKALLLGGVVLLFAALTACSDGLAPGGDDPLAYYGDYTVSGITTIIIDSPPYRIPHGANVGLRKTIFPPGNYIDTKISDEQDGSYFFYIEDLEDGWYVVDGWYSNATTDWFGTSLQFEWDSGDPQSRTRHVDMTEQ